MNDEIDIIMSPLSQSFERDGITLQVEIFRSDESDWTLEVVNPANTSIVWDKTFQSDKLALEEFHRAIENDGTQSFLDDKDHGAA